MEPVHKGPSARRLSALRSCLRSRRVHAGLLIGLAVMLLVYAVVPQLTRPKPFTSTEILVLGDSQLSFGAGPVLSEFFRDLPRQCRAFAEPEAVKRLAEKRFAMIGTRSTSLQSWVTTAGRPWELLCHKDKRWGVNASAWGTVKTKGKKYVQVGEGEKFQFCQTPETPLQNLLATGYYAPELLMIFVGGNGAGRLARDPKAAREDVDRFIEHLPDGTSCVFMMTAPIYSKPHNASRVIAQANLRTAFAAHGNRCSFVEGHTPGTRAAIEGQPQFFRRNEAGEVKDPYHANEAAASKFLALRRPALCRALIEQFSLTRRTNG